MHGGQADDALLHNAVFHFLRLTINHAGFGFGAVLNEQHRHPAANGIAGGAVHQVTPHRIHGDIDLGLAVFIKGLLSIGHIVTGRNHLLLKAGGALGLIPETELLGFAARRVLTCLHAELKVRGGTKDTLGLCSVLYTGQLNNNTVSALLLNQWLGNAQLIHPGADGCKVLFQGVILNRRDLRLRQGQDKEELIALGLFIQQEFVVLVAHHIESFGAGFLVPEAENDLPAVLHISATVTDPLFP